MRNILVVLLLAAPCFSNVYCKYDAATLNRSGVITPLSFASITVCPSGSSGAPCSPKSSLFNSSGAAIGNPATADDSGNYLFCVNMPGRYMIQVSAQGTNTAVQDNQIIPSDPNSPEFSGDVSIDGTLSVSEAVRFIGPFVPTDVNTTTLEVSGLSTLNGVIATTLNVGGLSTLSGGVVTPNFENIRFADQFAGATVTNKIDAAFADLSGSAGVVVIPSNVGSGLPTTVPSLGVMLDLRNVQGLSPSGGFGILRTFAPSASNQVIGFTIEQGLNPSVDQGFLNFGQATELFTFAGNTKNFSGSQQGVYGSFSHFGSGTTAALYGGAFESFNDGPSTALLVVGISATANNGGVAAGVPIQTPTNNGSTTNARAVDGVVHNFSSGTITNAVAFLAEAPTNTGGGAITNAIGFQVADMSTAANNFAISTGAGKVFLGDAVTMNSTAQISSTVGIGAPPLSLVGLLVNNSTLAGTTQIGMLAAPSCNSAAAGECEGVRARFDTAASVFTTNLGQAFHIVEGVKGAGSAITTEVGLDIDPLSNGGTNLAIRTGANTSQFGGPIQSTVTTGTAPLIIASTTNVPNLNASSLSGATFAAPGAIGSGTPSTGAFTTLSATGVITSTLATGTAPFTVASTTNVANLNASSLAGATFASPGAIGSTTPSTGKFTTVQSTIATGTAPLTVASTTLVTNLNTQIINGVTVTGTPSAGQGIIATSASAATWQAIGGSFSCVNVTPVTVSANTTGDQLLMACSITSGTLNTLGKTLSIQSAGVYSTPAASSTTVNLKVKLCTVSGCGSGTVITLASMTSAALGAIQATNDPFNLQMFSSTQTAGATAAFEAHGNLTIDTSLLTTAAEGVYADGNTATVGTIDSTGALFLQVTGAFSAASASNTMTQRQLTVESIN